MARIACVFSVEIFGTAERPLYSWRNIPYGLSLIAASLEEAGHEVRCWVICPATDMQAFAAEMVRDFGCDCVAATAVTTQFPIVDKLLQEVKRIDAKMLTIVGGTHPSLNPQDTIMHKAVDAICIGEGEKTMLMVAAALDRHERPAHISGMWIKVPGDVDFDRTPPLPYEINIDDLPMTNLHHWERWVKETDRSFRIVIGRGCPFGCTYCSNHALRKVATGKYVRVRSPQNVLKEVQHLAHSFPEIPELFLETETIGAVPGYAVELCNHLAQFNAQRPKPIVFGANLAVTTRLAQSREETDALLSAFRRANLASINIGLESGSERIRKDILNRPGYTNEDLIKFCLAAKEYGIKVTLFVLMGLPTETVKDFLLTVAIARACQPGALSESIFYPYPGTKLCDLSLEMHLFDPTTINVHGERTRAHLKLKGFPRWRISFEYVFITWRVFRGRWSTLRLAKRMAFKALSNTPKFLSYTLQLWSVLTKPSSAD
jgi:anaerobic magnesium-protoporphyrin IX monomethyl ester cyclase